MPIDPRRRGLTEDLPEATRQGWGLVDNVDVDSALGRLGLTGLDLEEATAAAARVLSSNRSRELIAGLATEAVAAWESTTPVRYFPDGDSNRHAFILATLAVLQPLAEASLGQCGVSEQVTTKTLHSTGAQVRLFRSQTGKLGVLSGWWQLYGLSGGYIEVGNSTPIALSLARTNSAQILGLPSHINMLEVKGSSKVTRQLVSIFPMEQTSL